MQVIDYRTKDIRPYNALLARYGLHYEHLPQNLKEIFDQCDENKRRQSCDRFQQKYK